MSSTYSIPIQSNTNNVVSTIAKYNINFNYTNGVNIGIPIHDTKATTTSHSYEPIITSSNSELDNQTKQQQQQQQQQQQSPPNQKLKQNIVISSPCNQSVEAFWLPQAIIEPIKIGTWVGSIDNGANVNCNLITFCPHGCGTHTECIGHIRSNNDSVLDHIPTHVLPSLLLTLSFSSFQMNSSSFSLEYRNTTCINNHYDNNDIVVSVNNIIQNVVQILQKLQLLSLSNSSTEMPTITTPTQGVTPTLDSVQLDNNTTNVDSNDKNNNNNIIITDELINTISALTNPEELLDIIPLSVLTLIRSFSRVLLIRTFLPQVMCVESCDDDDSENNDNNDAQNVQLKKTKNMIRIQQDILKNGQNSINNKNQDNTTFNKVVYNNTNPPYIPSNTMKLLLALFQPHHIVSDLPSLDKEDDGGMVLAHKMHFFSNFDDNNNHHKNNAENNYNFYGYSTKLTNFADKSLLEQCHDVEQRTNTELCWFPTQLSPNNNNNNNHTNKSDHSIPLGDVLMCDIRVAPIQSDAAPSMPIIYPINTIDSCSTQP